MAYSKEFHDRARLEIRQRRDNAELVAKQHKIEMTEKYPEFQFIEEMLAKTGTETVNAFALPKEMGDKLLTLLREKNRQLREERKNLLKELGLPPNYMDINYTCPECKDMGTIENYDEENRVSYGTRYCDCYMDLLKKYSAEKMSKMTPMELSSFEDFDLSYYSKSASGGAFSPYETMKIVYEGCLNYASTFDKDSNSLYFCGRTGLGKTHLSLAIANEAIKKGYNVVYGSVINFLNKLEREKFGRADTFETEDVLIGADLLILDDLGAEFSTPFAVSALYNIINSRIARGVPTIISSNLSVKEVQERYPESVASRIIGTFKIVEFSGKDIRQIQNNE